MTRHIFVTGGVVSSLGKGLTSASIGMLLTLAVALLLVCTVFVLPVLLSVVLGDRSLDSGGRSSQT